MPPHDDVAMDEDRDHRPRRSASAKKHRSRSSKQRGERKAKSKSQDARRSRSKSTGKKEAAKGGKDRGDKKKRHRKKPGPPPGRGKKNASSNKGRSPEEGVTVSQFLARQRDMQDEAAGRRQTMRQRLLHEQHERATGAAQAPEGEERAHYFDDDNSEYEEKERAVVTRDNKRLDGKQKVVDAVPADHPASSIVQTHRSCSLCQRTLPRAQFSERDRYTVNLSLAPGPTCRTCSMTVAAVRLKSMPGTEQLLLEYAQRGIAQGMLLLGERDANGTGAPISGLIESGEDLTQSGNVHALVVRQDSKLSNASGATGKELALIGGPMAEGNGAANGGNGNIGGMGPNVNAAFAGQRYGHGDGDRPDHVADCKYIDALLRMPCCLNLNAFGIFASSGDVSVSLAALEAVRLYGTLGGGCFVPHDCDGNPAPERKRRGKKERREPHAPPGDGKEAKSIVCLVLNEGETPRTAVLASQHYGWTALAIDPALGEEWDGRHDDIPGFTGYSGSISDFVGDANDATLVEFRPEGIQHLIIVGIQMEKDSLRLKGNGHINEIRSKYDDVPTTLVSVSPVRKATLAPQRREGQCGSKLEKDVGYEPNCSYIDEGVFSACRQVEVWNFHNAEDDDGEGSEGEYSDEGSEYSNEGSQCSNDGQTEESDRQYDDRTAESGPLADEADGNSFGAQIKRAAKGAKKKKDAQRRNWLEDRVSEHKQRKEKEGKAQDCNKSLSSLSTKGTWDKLPSKDGGVDMKLVKAVDKIKEEYAEGDRAQEENAAAAWAPPDEEVWERAMAKHGEQETLVNQFEEYYDDKGGRDDESGDDDEPESDANDHGLPPGWEAIHDPSSGEYYYNNWDTGEVTWDHPLGNDPMVNSHTEGSASQSVGAEEGPAANVQPANPFDDDAEEATAPTNPHLKVYEQSARFDSDNEGSQQHMHDDASSTSSGIGALARWNNKPSAAPDAPPGASHEEEDMIQWSDEEADDQVGPLVRSSSMSQKKQPWHSKDIADDNSSFASYNEYK